MTASIPPGLDYLTYVDHLIVQQQIDMIEIFTGWETKNRYVVKNGRGENVYYAVEQNDLLTMNYFGSERPFDMLVMDNLRSIVLQIHRPFQLQGFACCGLVQEIQITSGVGQLLGTVTQEWDMCRKPFTVQNANGEMMLRIEGPACTFDWVDTDFDIITVHDNAIVGAITRKFPGLYQEMFTHADVFGVRFPVDLEVGLKAVLLGATFLIDFMYYERTAGHPLRHGDNGYGYGYGYDRNNGWQYGLLGMAAMGGGHRHHNYYDNDYYGNSWGNSGFGYGSSSHHRHYGGHHSSGGNHGTHRNHGFSGNHHHHGGGGGGGFSSHGHHGGGGGFSGGHHHGHR